MPFYLDYFQYHLNLTKINKDKYYLGVNVNKVLFKQLHVGISLLVLLILNIVVLILVTIPVNQVTVLQIYLSFFIILLCYVIVFGFSYNLIIMWYKNEKEIKVKNKIKGKIYKKIFTEQLLKVEGDEVESKTKKQMDLAKKVSKEFSLHMSSYHNEDYYEVKEVFEFVSGLYENEIYTEGKMQKNIGVYIGKYVEDVYSYKNLPEQQLYDLLAEFNTKVNGPKSRDGYNLNINIFVGDKV